MVANIEELKAKYADEDRIVAVASNILWDTDGEEGEEVDDLPTQVELIVGEDICQYWANPSLEDIEDEVSEYLSNAYGFCHKGFEFCIL